MVEDFLVEKETLQHIRCTLPSLALLHHKTSQTTHPGDNPVMSIYHTGQPYSNKIELHRYTIVWEKLVVGWAAHHKALQLSLSGGAQTAIVGIIQSNACSIYQGIITVLYFAIKH